MLFRRNKPLQVELVAAPTVNPAHPLPAIPGTSRHPARTLEEILGLPVAPTGPRRPTHRATGLTSRHTSSSPTRAGHTPGNTVRREPSSKKTGHATIRTDATDTQAAFESDAFAIHMPTTRLPVIDQPTSPVSKSPTAQVEAYRTYQEKARQIRERNNGLGIKTAYKVASYDSSTTERKEKVTSSVQTKNPLESSPKPAGSFPISPPLPQSSWESPSSSSSKRHGVYIESARIAEESHHVLRTPHKPLVTPGNISPNTRRYRSHADSTAGAANNSSAASSSSSPTRRSGGPANIRVNTPKQAVSQQQDRIQTESLPSLYNRPSATATTTPPRHPPPSRSPSPVKTLPNFTRHNSIEGDSIFGYTRRQDLTTTATTTISGPRVAPTTTTTTTPAKTAKPAAAAEKPVKPTLTTRFPWVRTTTPRIPKPTTTPVVFRSAAKAAVAKPARAQSTYIDPFEKLDNPNPKTSALPPAPPPVPIPSLFNPPSPSRTTLRPPPSRAPATHLSTGFTQLRNFGLLVLKIALYVYLVVAVWVVLDAVREAVRTVGVPFRVLRPGLFLDPLLLV
ncbi:hypothetical protein GMOD_00008053 [Pyrenophora seminiperda CCB06]|uniref:Uncharacterized protein n=1 Tax=Pyrenophora seminiperda CCB06 TaxID=1302712 RepID=A0A3M7MGH0_9PLEO|nr:hypothetical protein GMOD_00008053 [Pyrenophora seminiperda CCB06]